ncbi:carbohydrate-binding protein [Chengkuizengella axinellae]|uniref:Carbohydrate-binding protein n=1 Tax=Chengkuizengella axinellae TaxID=3064388 RepID=A0ABT9J478_9BACL|nr:carbohydrate-binding protein [Chengkuizengella sp. 2205SS18-9]MDP5275759.1 carbohydrate-binding protein [Chengkuizengella sp. 2205SS18-9]
MFKLKRSNLRIFTVLSLALLLAFSSLNLNIANANNNNVQVWLTTVDEQNLLKQQADVFFETDTTFNPLTIQVDENIQYQEMDGFGAAVSGSAAYLMNQLDETQQTVLLSDLFGEQGVNFSFVRHTIGASDFSLSSFTYNDIPQGQTDLSLEQFTIAQDQVNVIPVLQDIKGINPDVKILGTPWSAPAWMKNNEELNGGTLNPEYYQVYAEYLTKYVQSYENEGLPIYAMTVQNEPHHETSGYPSMYMSAEEQTNFIKNNLGPTFEAQAIDTKILSWDHNWNEYEYPIQVLDDPAAKSYVDGSAFHCYGGTPDKQSEVYNAHPDKGIWFTECSGGEWETAFDVNMKWNMSNVVIGSIRNWSKSVLLWNLALDENFGPINGGCTDCRGVVTIDSNTGEITKNVEYYVLGHVSKFVEPGAVRIDSNYDERIETVAFKNPDGSKVLLAHNNSESEQTFKVKTGGEGFEYTLPIGAVATFVWEGSYLINEVNAFDKMEAESFSAMSGIETETNGNVTNVGWTDNGDYIMFENVNFGDGAIQVDVSVGSASKGGSLELRIGSPTGTVIGEVMVNNTGGWHNYETVSADITSAKGINDLYVVFKGTNGIGNVDWIQFHEFTQTNLLLDSGFESGNLSSWNEWHPDNLQLAQSVDSEGPLNGNYKLVHWAPTDYQQLTSQILNVPNGTYKASVWVKSGGSQNELHLFAKGYGGEELKAVVGSDPVGTWTQYFIEDIQVTNGEIEVGIWSNSPGNNWAVFDDFELVKEYR